MPWRSFIAGLKRRTMDKAKYREWLSTQPEDVRKSAFESGLPDAKRALGTEYVAAAEAMDDDESDRALSQEIAIMKARDQQEYARLLA